MQLPITIIEKEYSDAYMQPENLDHPHAGVTIQADSVLRPEDLADNNESIDLQASEETNAIALEAHKEAQAVYATLTKQQRQATDPGSLAIKLFNQKMLARRRAEPTRKPNKTGKMQIMASREVERSTKSQIRMAAEKAAAEAGRPRRKKRRASKPASKFSVTKTKAATKKPVTDVDWLKVPDLAAEPQSPDVRVRFSWRDTQQSAIRKADFNAHWATAVQSSDGDGFSMVNFIVDTRHGASMDRLPDITDDPDAEMTVVFQVEDAKYELTAIKTTLQHCFGIFHFIQVMALK